VNLIPGNPARIELDVVDLVTPAVPVIVGRVTLPAGQEIVLVGSTVYVAALGAGLQVVDVSNPLAPSIIGSVDTPGNATGVAVANGWAYVADNTAVQVLDVSVPSRPTLRATLSTSACDGAIGGTRLS